MMAEFQKTARVTVENSGNGWHVTVEENGVISEQEFDTEDAAEDYAHSKRLLLGLVPQADLA